MSKQFKMEVKSNEELVNGVYKMVVNHEFEGRPGQFANIKVEGQYLRRPISISRIHKDSFEMLYKLKGEGTKKLAQYKANQEIDIILPLGNGFDLVEEKKVLLIGGGIGVPPLLELYHQLKTQNKSVELLIGVTGEEDNIYSEYNPIVTTILPSKYYQGNVIEYLKDHDIDYDYVYACGPMGMLNAIQEYVSCPGQISIEEKMGCGFGVCNACTCKTKDKEYKRICVEGPVFKIGELDLNDY
ncbi:MAG: dihydroorotate dehydrogenase electron transfer subunit [Erysipelotrichales bacterium]